MSDGAHGDDSAMADAAPAPAKIFAGEAVYLTEDCCCTPCDSDSDSDREGPAGGQRLSALLEGGGARVVASVAECTAVVLTPTREVALDAFAGKRVFGVRYVEECAARGTRLPAGALTHPLLSHALEGVVVACDASLAAKPGAAAAAAAAAVAAAAGTGGLAERTDAPEEHVGAGEISAMVRMLGGTFAGCTVSAQTSVFVGATALSDSYQSAVRHGVPIVRPAWVVECFRRLRRVPPDDYRLPTFAGCVVCITGFSVASRTTIQQMVTYLGGSFRPDFSRCCTHLVAVAPRGPKFRVSFLWQIPAVTLNWFFDSVNRRVCLPPDDYLVPYPADAKQPSFFPQPGAQDPAARAQIPLSLLTLKQQLLQQQQPQQQPQPQRQQQQPQQPQQQQQQQQAVGAPGAPALPKQRFSVPPSMLLMDPSVLPASATTAGSSVPHVPLTLPSVGSVLSGSLDPSFVAASAAAAAAAGVVAAPGDSKQQQQHRKRSADGRPRASSPQPAAKKPCTAERGCPSSENSSNSSSGSDSSASHEACGSASTSPSPPQQKGCC